MKNKIIKIVTLIVTLSLFVNLTFGALKPSDFANENEKINFAKAYSQAKAAFELIILDGTRCYLEEDQACESAIDLIKSLEKKMFPIANQELQELLTFHSFDAVLNYTNQRSSCWKRLQIIFDFNTQYGSFINNLSQTIDEDDL